MRLILYLVHIPCQTALKKDMASRRLRDILIPVIANTRTMPPEAVLQQSVQKQNSILGTPPLRKMRFAGASTARASVGTSDAATSQV